MNVVDVVDGDDDYDDGNGNDELSVHRQARRVDHDHHLHPPLLLPPPLHRRPTRQPRPHHEQSLVRLGNLARLGCAADVADAVAGGDGDAAVALEFAAEVVAALRLAVAE